jgi:hypothetical protein
MHAILASFVTVPMNSLLGMSTIRDEDIGGNNRPALGMELFTSGTGEETTRKRWCSRHRLRLSNGESTDFRVL